MLKNFKLSDLKNMNTTSLTELAMELRKEIIDAFFVTRQRIA